MGSRLSIRVLAALAVIATVSAANATWSIIVIDTRTREIAIGSATCLTSFNLKRGLPVVRVGVGAAAAQSFVDSSGQNRLLIWNELAQGTHPDAILALLRERDTGHEGRQYGIVDVRGRALTFTGRNDGAYANGKIGRSGTLVYAIQGNVITCQAVIDQAEAELLNAPFGLPEKLMRAMEGARMFAGDGRCSCSQFDPTGCGCPPPGWDTSNPLHKSAHIGFIIDTRRGDTDGVCNATDGCANGNYFMAFNLANATQNTHDPVVILRQRYDAWRLDLIGRVDAIESQAAVTPPELPADGASEAQMLIELRDWQGNPVTSGVTTLTVVHDDNSAGSSSIGPVQDLGNGVYEVTLTAGTASGTDAFRVTAADSAGERILMPSPALRLVSPGPIQPPLRRPASAGAP